jgi:hypothetical protein
MPDFAYAVLLFFSRHIPDQGRELSFFGFSGRTGSLNSASERSLSRTVNGCPTCRIGNVADGGFAVHASSSPFVEAMILLKTFIRRSVIEWPEPPPACWKLWLAHGNPR